MSKNTGEEVSKLNDTINQERFSKKFRRILREVEFLREHKEEFAQLTPREVEVLSLLARGYTNEKISGRLCISPHTVKNHRKHIKTKLKAKTFVDLLRYAQAFDLV